MAATDGAKFKFHWQNFRYDKKIEPHEKTTLQSPAVVKLAGIDDKDIYGELQFKNTYSFTSHITVYETCALQYKFYKELEFMPVRANAMLFGTLVHETIEDIHHAALRHEEQTITQENVSRWFDSNYVSLTKTEHTYLAGP